jgi:hypothetical protein
MAHSSVAAAMSFWLARGGASALSMLGVGVDAVTDLSAQLPRVFAARGGFPCH